MAAANRHMVATGPCTPCTDWIDTLASPELQFLPRITAAAWGGNAADSLSSGPRYHSCEVVAREKQSGIDVIQSPPAVTLTMGQGWVSIQRIVRPSIVERSVALASVHRLNVLNSFLSLSPLRVYLVTLSGGIALVIISLVVGVGVFSAVVEVLVESSSVRLDTIPLGYVSQLNYGVWYVLLCPIFFLFAAAGVDALERLAPPELKRECSIRHLAQTPTLAVIGVLVLVFFVQKNILVEVRDYRSLGLGWVQAEALLDVAKQHGGPLSAGTKWSHPVKNKRFYLIKTDKGLVRADVVLIHGVGPSRFRVRSHAGLIAFIVAAKTWAGVFEAFPVYLSMLLLIVGIRILKKLTPAVIQSANDGRYGLKWLIWPTTCFLIMGCLSNIFCAFRYIANVNKGSFGTWDQYLGFLVLSPAIVVWILGIATLITVYRIPVERENSLFETTMTASFSTWFSSWFGVVLLLVGYVSADTYKLLLGTAKALSPFK